jgi:hypothetical protein
MSRSDLHRGGDDDGPLIWTRQGVVTASSLEPEFGRRIYYLKISETGEIFQLGDLEYEIWKLFEDGLSFEAACSALDERFGGESRDRLRTFVGELAGRGLLTGAVPSVYLPARPPWMHFQIDPTGRARKPPYFSAFQLILCDPNAFFGWVAQRFSFVRHLRWPVVILSVIAALSLFKHSSEYAADFQVTMEHWTRLGFNILTLLSINLARIVAQGAVSRYYGATVRYFSLDFIFGFWPRFYADKSGMRRLERTPQLWSHSTPFFVRLGFFVIGTLGWVWWRPTGNALADACLLWSQAAIVDLVVSTFPVFKTETYFWFCAYFSDPFLRERGLNALFGVFKGEANPLRMDPAERLALTLYGLSLVSCFLVIAFVVTKFFLGTTTVYNGVGFILCMVVVGIVLSWILVLRGMRRQWLATRSSRRGQMRTLRRDARRDAALAPTGDK